MTHTDPRPASTRLSSTIGPAFWRMMRKASAAAISGISVKSALMAMGGDTVSAMNMVMK